MASKEPKILITASMVSFSTRRAQHTARSSHPYFADVKKALQDGDTGLAYRWLAKKTEDMKQPKRVKLVGNALEFDGQKFHEAFAEAYAMSKDDPRGTEALNLFFTNLSENPNPISVKAFTSFMAKTRMPITDRGTFLAYRRCNKDWVDHHSRSFDNRPGSVCEMDREDCDANQHSTCSTGFHVCSHTYLNNFSSGPDLVVEINPRDVVAVPPDYNLSKMRLRSMRVLCTLPYFKRQLLNYYQDALAMVPFFVTAQTESWNVMEDVTLTEEHKPRKSFMTVEAWLARKG